MSAKSMKPATVALLLAACLAGCAAPKPPKPWIKAGGDRQDEAASKSEAEKGAVSSDPNPMLAAYEKAERRDKLMDLCMRSKGWTR